MSEVDDPVTRRIVAAVLGVLGVVLLLDVLVIGIVKDSPDLDGARVALFVIIGALLIVGGVLTFAWPKRWGGGHAGPAEEVPPS